VAAIGDGDKVMAGLYDVIHLIPDNPGALREGDVVNLVTPPGGLPHFFDDVDMVSSGSARIVAVGPTSASAVVTHLEREIVLGSRTLGPGGPP
jgi:hypothetical protein